MGKTTEEPAVNELDPRLIGWLRARQDWPHVLLDRTAVRQVIAVLERAGADAQQIIADFLERSGQWLTNQATHEEYARQVRDVALEEAAAICDSVENYANPMTANDCADAIRALKVAPAAAVADAQPIELQGVADTLANGGGFWRSCSGCHELNEGVDTGPMSEALGCNLGNGCSECGGIGAVWDTTDYQAMADSMAASMVQAAPQAGQLSGNAGESHDEGENAARGRAIDRACIESPPGWQVRIDLERDAGVAYAINPDGHEQLIDFADSFSDQINAAIDAAIAASKGANHG